MSNSDKKLKKDKSAVAEAQGDMIKIWSRIMRYTWIYRHFAAIAFVGLVGAQILAVAIPQILRYVIDRGVARQDSDYMLRAGLLVVGLGILRGLMGFLSRYFGELQSHRVAYDLRNEVYGKVQRLPFVYHDKVKTGSLITRAISDVDEVQRYLAFGLLDGLNTLLIVIFATGMMLYIKPLLAIVAILPLVPLSVESKRFADFVDREWRGVMELISKLSEHLQEVVVGAEVVRAFAREKHEIKRFGKTNQNLFYQYLKVIGRWAFYIPLSATLVSISIVATLVVGGWMREQGGYGITVGIIVQFNFYILLMSNPLRFFGFVIMLTNQAIASGRRVFELLDEPEHITDKPDAKMLPGVKGVVHFENVNFRFADDLPYALQEINLKAYPGDIIALMGLTGAGKSSLVNLIPRFYEVSDGRITIDEYDIRDVTLNSLRSQIGIVLQESLLFSATIRENIAFGVPDATDEQIIAATKAANAHHFIIEFPDGYDTLVGERGVTVSGGQRQRIAIARALLINPRILILDDSMSSVDTETEYLIQQALNRLMKGRTTFVIAQRLTTIQNASEILVLDKGRIVERGRHEDLIQGDGIYHEIYELQLENQERARREMADIDSLLAAAIAGD